MIAEVGDMRERQRQQDRDAVGAAEAGQHADDHAEQDADEHQQDVAAACSTTAKPCNSVAEFFHGALSPNACDAVRAAHGSVAQEQSSIGPLDSGTRNQTLEHQEDRDDHADRHRRRRSRRVYLPSHDHEDGDVDADAT